MKGDKGQGRQIANVLEVSHTLASTSAQVENNSLWIQGQGREGGAKKSPGHSRAACSHASQSAKTMLPIKQMQIYFNPSSALPALSRSLFPVSQTTALIFICTLANDHNAH